MLKDRTLKRLTDAVIAGDEIEAKKAAEDIVKFELDPLEAIQIGAMKGLEVVGKKFEDFEIYLPDVMLAADAMKAVMGVLLPEISQNKMGEVITGKVVTGTAMGDIHDIGKNIFSVLLSVAGFEVYDLGMDVAPQKFVENAEKLNADIIAISSLLTSSLYYQKDVVKRLEDMDIRNKYYVVIGGGAVTPEWVERVGADGYGRHAYDGVKVCKTLLRKRVPPPLSKPLILLRESG